MGGRKLAVLTVAPGESFDERIGERVFLVVFGEVFESARMYICHLEGEVWADDVVAKAVA